MVSGTKYLPAGTVLKNRYKITSTLSKGGFGLAYKARDISNKIQNSVLIKQLRPQKNEVVLEIARKKFQKEAKVLESLGERHPQIPKLFDYFEEKEEFYIVQQFIDGVDFEKKLHLDPESTEETLTLTESQLVDFLEQTLEILKTVHFNKIIHRDIKPSNLIWHPRINNDANEEAFQVFLIDFGCVKEIEKYVFSSNQEVQSSVVIGTPFYMPPEQQRKEPQFNTDLYALGWVAIQAVTGLKTNQEDIRSSWREKANIKDDLKLILAQMIHPKCKKPEDKSKDGLDYRYQTASDVLEDLKKFKEGLPVKPLTQILASPDPETIKINPPENQSDKWAKWLGILFGLILLGAPLWIAWEIWFKPRVWETSDKASIGEEVYFETGQECTDEVRDKQYIKAKECFAGVMSKNLNNPETAIYYNNSFALSANEKPYYLAAVVPISTNPNLANEILRGVAHAQHLFNKQGGVAGRQLVVVVANDANNKDDQAIDVAKLLRDENKIVGIIGHNSTTATEAGIQEYKQKNYPWISVVL
ncbi:protein kinase [Waterburya agarophytonicola K14]|uniref:non-specific serine/threonine protein kinase n=1 Tax=Waterburya agarophytonicola KI4 TaxID=2874699 RepID=A0A964BWW6_9CYAN|nr:bifunctional serine/threonine-protein kinase/ABC transporter substrate-binding protein [Waterburya agarophytonicola]MCC0179192.1 protein kinase [Waterburya agarophytonicola KI4]